MKNDIINHPLFYPFVRLCLLLGFILTILLVRTHDNADREADFLVKRRSIFDKLKTRATL
jgi:hypothetical protein